MSVNLVEGFLDELASLVIAPPVDGKDAASLAQDLSNVALNDVTPEEMGLVASNLFKGAKNILDFLKNTMEMKHKELANARAELLELIADLTKRLGTKSAPEYAQAIRETCYYVFRRETVAKVKANSLDPIVAIVELQISRFNAENLCIRDMSDGMIKEYASSKTQPSVKSAILQTLGIFSEYFPEQMKERAQMLVHAILDDLSNQFKSKQKPDQKLIAGAIKGLASLLVHFSAQLTSDEAKLQTAHTCVFVCGLEVPEGIRTYDTLKSSLMFLTRHAPLFKRYLTQKYSDTYTKLKQYCSHNNRAVRRLAFGALDAFLTQVAGEISNPDQKRSHEANVAAFKFFIQDFWTGLESQSAGLYEVSVAIRGFGKFARVTKRYLGVSQVKKMLDKLILFSERFYMGGGSNGSAGGGSYGSNDSVEDAVSHLPNFITAFASILMELDTTDIADDETGMEASGSSNSNSMMSYVDHLERLIGTFFIAYPQMYDHQRWPNYVAMTRLFVALYTKGPMALRTLLSRIMFQGLTLTCSKPIELAPPTDPTKESQLSTENYFEYQDLWKNLLVPKVPEDLLLEQGDSFDLDDLKAIIFDQFIESIIKILQKLVLQYVVVKITAKGIERPVGALLSPGPKAAPQQPQKKPANTDGAAAENEEDEDPEIGERVKPSVPKDFELFLNLVEFCKLILPQLQPQSRFDKWIYVLSRELIVKSNQYPLVSGFYKLLSIALKISDKTNYFEPPSANVAGKPPALEDPDQMDVDGGQDDAAAAAMAASSTTTETESKQICFILVSKFLREVLARMRQYKDELLGSCLQLVLSVPQQFINIELLIVPLQTAFRLGLAHLPLCEIGLDALEHWLKVKRADVLRCLPQILPYLNDYLAMTATSSGGSGGFGANANGASAVVEFKAEHDRNLQSNLQLRIVRLLGKLGGFNTALVPEFDLASLMAWDSVQRIDLKFPLMPEAEGEIRMFIDDMMPRICTLAESGSDRQTKVAACELLHAVTIFMVGRNAHAPSPQPLEDIYKRIFPVIMRLAVDVEQIAKQLFEPLAFQLIRWFTKNRQQENKQTMALLEAIVDAAGNPSDGALREFSAKCLTEFLKWSIKHSPVVKETKSKSSADTSATSESSSPFNALSLFKRLYSMANHPNAYKRLGCALALKQLYRVFREDENLVSIFVLEISHTVLVSLRHAANDSEALGTVQLYTQVLEALGRIIIAYKTKLVREDQQRRMHHSLAAFVRFVFTQCARPERPVRHAAFTLFQTLVMQLPGHTSPAEWVSYMIRTKGSVREAVVQHFDDKATLRDAPAAEHSPTENNLWFHQLGASLDGLVWLLSSDLISADALLGNDDCSRPLLMANDFIKDYALISMEDPSFASMTPSELEKYNSTKCYLIMRIFKFHLVLAEKFAAFYTKLAVGGSTSATAATWSTKGPLLTVNFARVLIMSILAPEKLGFQTNNSSLMTKLTRLTARLLKSLMDVLPAESRPRTVVTQCIKKILVGNDYNIFVFDFRHSYLHVEKTRQVSRGYQTLHGTGLLIPNFTMNAQNGEAIQATAPLMSDRLLHEIFSRNNEYSPLELIVVNSVFQLCFSLDPGSKTLLTLLLDESPVERPRTEAAPATDAGGAVVPMHLKTVTRGEIFYSNFKDQIDEFFIAHLGEFAKPIISAVHRSALMLRVLMSIADRHVMYPKQYNGKKFLDAIFLHLAPLASWAASTAQQEQRESLLELLKKLVRINAAYVLGDRRDASGVFVRDAVVQFLSRSTGLPLSFKTEVLDLLTPILIHSTSRESALFLAPIRERVRDLIVYDFPMTSTDYPEQSAVYGQYIDALNVLLTSLSASGSLLLLEELFPILREPNHRHIVRIDQELANFVAKLSDERARAAFDVCLRSFNDMSLSEDLRLAIIRKLCIPILKKLSVTLLIDAIGTHIAALMETVKQCVVASDDDSIPVLTLDKSTVVTRLGVLYLIECAYRLLSANTIKERITIAAYMKGSAHAKGNEITEKAVRAAHAVKSRIKVEYAPDVSQELQLELHCTAYNALASVVSCTQSKDTFYNVFCFKENPAKKELLWENIVDLTAHHKFEVETNFAIASRDITALYSRAMQQQLSATPADSDTYLRPRTRYISSEYLADSSLSHEISNSAFFAKPDNQSVPTDSDAMDVDQQGSPSSSETASENKKAPFDLPSGPARPLTAGADEAIELDALNSNPCMLAILNLLDDMQTKFGAQWAADRAASGGSNLPPPPIWMKDMLQKFQNERTHLNVRLFIAKVVMNKPEVFAPYAIYWFKVLLKFILTDEISGGDPDAARGFHYFLRDLCVCILKWDYTPSMNSSEEQRLAVQFVEYLMKRCLYPSRQVVWSNIQLVRLFIQRWRAVLMRAGLSKQVPFDYISYDNVKNSKQTKMSRQIGMQLLDCLLNNGFDLYDMHLDSGINKIKYFECLVSNLMFASSDVYKVTAHVLGLALAASREQPDLASEIEQLIRVKLNAMFDKDDQVRLFACFDKITQNAPAFVDAFFKRIFAIFKRLRGEAKPLALKLILLRSGHVDQHEMFISLQPRLPELLRHKEGNCQLTTLKTIKLLSPHLQYEQVETFVDVLIESFQSHSDEDTRMEYYQLCMNLYDNFARLRSNREFRLALLRGLADESPDISKALFDFWDAPTRLKEVPIDRLQALMSELYHPDVESHWVRYASVLILKLCSRSQVYDAKLLNDLTEAQFVELSIDSSYAYRPQAMTPLFSPQSQFGSMDFVSFSSSQDGSLAAFFGAGGSLSQSAMDVDRVAAGGGHFRATQQPVFQQTLASGGGAIDIASASQYGYSQAPKNLASKFQAVTFNLTASSSATLGATDSGTFKKPGLPAPRRPQNNNPRATHTVEISASQNDAMDISGDGSGATGAAQGASVTIMKRFLKTPQGPHNPSFYYARKNLNKKKLEETIQRDRARQRLHKVTLYRKYRQGELPDVGTLTHRSFAEPLMALVARDDHLARLFLAHLFDTVVGERFVEFRPYLVEMLQTTRNSSTAFTYWLLRVAFDSLDAADADVTKSLMWDASLIGSGALKSINYHMGAMILEKQLILAQVGTARAPAKRKGPGAAPVDVDLSSLLLESWLQLSKVYKSLADDDIVLSIYTKHLSSLEETRTALESELIGQFEEALSLYESALDKIDTGVVKTSSTEANLLEDSRLECLAKMTNWDALYKNAISELGDRPTSVWKLSKDRDLYLYTFLHSSLKLKDQWGGAASFVDESFALSRDYKDLLESEYSPDLAFLSLKRDDFGKSRFYITRAYQDFLREWASLPHIATEGRQSKLQRLQKLVELEELLDFVSHDWSFGDLKHLTRLLTEWESRRPSVKDSIVQWDDIATQRADMLYKIRDHFNLYKKDAKNGKKVDSDQLLRTLILAKVNFSLLVAKGALSQSNFKVAHKSLSKAMQTWKGSVTTELGAAGGIAPDGDFETNRGILKLHLLQARKTTDPTKAATKYAKLLKWIESKESLPLFKEDLSSYRRFVLMASQARAEIYKLSRENPTVVFNALNDANFEAIVKNPGKWDFKTTPKRLVQIAYSGMHDFMKVQAAKEEANLIGSEDMLKVAKSHLELSNMMELLLKHQDETKEALVADVARLLTRIISSTMTAIRLGSRRASETFPRMLQLILRETAQTGPIFREEVAKLEPWMLLRWVGNMLAILGKDYGQYVVESLNKIAETYPQAVYYQFKITSESLSDAALKRAKRLSELLKIDLLDSFINSLTKMTNPNHRLKDWFESIKTALQAPRRDQNELRDLWQQMRSDCCDPRAPGIGSDNIKFAKILQPLVDAAFGADGSKLIKSMTAVEFSAVAEQKSAIAAAIADFSDDKKNPRMGYQKLSLYSTWLQHFDSSEHSDVQIEIPGQYSGHFHKPQPELHIKIASFDPTVLVMSSMRRPKRLMIRGDDEKEHPFLVKGGEDLRLDQRVQQLFSVMNEILATNPATQKRKMRIHTYQVVPMTSRVGIIEWVDGTKPLKGILESQVKRYMEKKAAEAASAPAPMSRRASTTPASASKTSPDHYDFRNDVQQIHHNFILQFETPDVRAGARGMSAPGHYNAMFLNAKRDDAERKMKAQLEKIPPFLLRDGIMALSPDPEAFVALRQRAVISLAVFSIASYIIGIGDRHLDNFLLNLRNGDIIGIDFGHAFGSATQVLPIPEMVPFRMTPQLLNMMRPFDGAATLLKYHMVHALTALHESRQILINVMDVFINEPLVDWLLYTKRTFLQEKLKVATLEEARDHFARRKIDLTIQKLNMANPAWITEQELLESGKQKDVKFIRAVVDQVRARGDRRPRSSVGEYCETIQQQVECLMDQATDYNILARAWMGWQSWM